MQTVSPGRTCRSTAALNARCFSDAGMRTDASAPARSRSPSGGGVHLVGVVVAGVGVVVGIAQGLQAALPGQLPADPAERDPPVLLGLRVLVHDTVLSAYRS